MTRRLLIALLLAGLAAGAAAQLRFIPENAKRGTLGALSPMEPMAVALDGKRVELSAGAQIRNAANLIVLPTALPQDKMLVKYQLSADGRLHRAWVLTPQEAAQPDAKK